MKYFAFTLPLLLGANLVAATPEAQSGDIEMRNVEGQNPFDGFSVEPYSGKNCGGDSQDNTNVNLGTSACINVSNAGSISIAFNYCSTADFKYHHTFDCGDDAPFAVDQFVKGNARTGETGWCLNNVYNAKSIKVVCD